MSMDIAYNYDEQWLLHLVMERGLGKAHWIRNARELGAWFAQRDAWLPMGSLTAHHLDSHDSFRWPEPGQKWRRKQYGVPATAALMAVFALSGGPYMTYVGGEEGIQDEVRAVSSLRAAHFVIARGWSDYAGVRAGDDDICAVLREDDQAQVLVLVNLRDRTVVTDVALESSPPASATEDLLGGETLVWSYSMTGSAVQVTMVSFALAAYDVGAPR